MTCLLIPAAGWAAVGRPANPVSPTAASKAEQQVTHYRTKVKRLEKGVVKQEAASRKATQNLRKQNQEIADLRRQLQALHAQASPEHH